MAPARPVGKENRPEAKVLVKERPESKIKERNEPKISAKDLARKPVGEKSPRLVPRTTGTLGQRSPRGAPDWREVTSAKAEADALEAELKALDLELESLKTQLAEAEAQEVEAEEQLTSQSGAMLSEYAAAHERFKDLEGQLREAREGLAMRRKENLELSRKNLELDRASSQCRAEIQQAKDELERCSRSQNTIDEEITRQLNACEELRCSAEGQSERLQADLRRSLAMKGKLEELAQNAPDKQQEVSELLVSAFALAQRTENALQECLQVVEKGIVPAEDGSASGAWPEA